MIGDFTKKAAYAGFLAIVGLTVVCHAQLSLVDSSVFHARAAAPRQISPEPQLGLSLRLQCAGGIPLRSSTSPGPGAKLWEQANENRSVRNVTVTTLAPILPDSSKATGTAAIVAPGGAFMELEMDAEGY